MYIMLVGCYVLLELAEKLALKAGFEQLPAPHYVYLTCPPRSLVPGQAGPTNSVTGCGGGWGRKEQQDSLRANSLTLKTGRRETIPNRNHYCLF